MSQNLEIAETIRQQLGGHRFSVMTGAKHFLASESYLTFRLPRCKGGVNAMRITLTPMDVYTVEALKCNVRAAQPVQTVETAEMVYAENLQEVFTSMTGLYTKF